LSNDLYTNGFNIITNSLDQRLKIGIGLSGQFAQGGFIEFNNVVDVEFKLLIDNVE